MSNPVGWFEIYVQDMPRAKAFYEAVFQQALEPMRSPDTFPEIKMFLFPMQNDAYGAGGALVKMEGFTAGANSTIVYFSSVDCTTEVERVRQYGDGAVIRDKWSIGENGFIALIRDTEGNIFGLHSLE